MTTFREDMTSALMQECYGKIRLAKMNITVLLGMPSGVGGHSEYAQSIREQAKIIAEQKGLLEVYEKNFYYDE
tara:strand:+ start:33 stop:251 length:219 start_codon:yes stop_codon:yes gene_type:complete